MKDVNCWTVSTNEEPPPPPAQETRKIGNNKKLRKEGINIYKKIFSYDAKISAGAEKILKAKGPNGWSKVVINALEKYNSTQHLIGTQVVEFSKFNIKNSIISRSIIVYTKSVR